MKINQTVEIIPFNRIDARQLKDKLIIDRVRSIKNDHRTHEDLYLIRIEGFHEELAGEATVAKYYPGGLPRTFQSALALIDKNATLVMDRGGAVISYSNGKFFNKGKDWSPTAQDILSQEKEWYVYPSSQQSSFDHQVSRPSYQLGEIG